MIGIGSSSLPHALLAFSAHSGIWPLRSRFNQRHRTMARAHAGVVGDRSANYICAPCLVAFAFRTSIPVMSTGRYGLVHLLDQEGLVRANRVGLARHWPAGC